MAEYLRTARDRKRATLNDAPDTKFYFESQKFSDIPNYQNRSVQNRFQRNDWGAQEVRKHGAAIDAAAARYSIDPDIVKAIIYTEVSRGWYGYAPENFDAATHKILPRGWLKTADTILPGNISPEWQLLIPGSDVHNSKDNIELTTKLISRIAKRLDEPSIENIYSLYNSLSHDRTYVNKQAKTTPYFAKKAMEAKAWEKDDWSAPEFPKIDDAPKKDPPPDRHGFLGDGLGKWGFIPASDSGGIDSPVLRALEKYRRSAASDGQPSAFAREAVSARPGLQPTSFGMGDVAGRVPQSRLIAPANAASPLRSQGRPDLRGIVSGEPMPAWSFPLPLGGLLKNSDASGNVNWFNTLAGLAPGNSAPAEPPEQTTGSMPERRLSRRTYSASPTSVVDTGAGAVPFVWSDDANYSGGLLGRLAALTGIDPQDPDQFAPPAGGLLGLYLGGRR